MFYLWVPLSSAFARQRRWKTRKLNYCHYFQRREESIPRTINGWKEIFSLHNFLWLLFAFLPQEMLEELQRKEKKHYRKVTFGMKIIQFEVNCWKFVIRKIAKAIGFGTCKLAGDNSLFQGRTLMRLLSLLSGMLINERAQRQLILVLINSKAMRW